MTIAPQALLFDLGGVIVDIDFQRAIDVWQRHSPLPAQEIERLFQFDAAYERHERGEIEAAGYYAHLASLLRIDGEHEAIAEGWNADRLENVEGARAAGLEAVHVRGPQDVRAALLACGWPPA